MKIKVTNRKKTGIYINLKALDRPGQQAKFLPSKGSIEIDEAEMSEHLETLARRDFIRITEIREQNAPRPAIPDNEE